MIAAIIELWKVDNCSTWFKWYGSGAWLRKRIGGRCERRMRPTSTGIWFKRPS